MKPVVFDPDVVVRIEWRGEPAHTMDGEPALTWQGEPAITVRTSNIHDRWYVLRGRAKLRRLRDALTIALRKKKAPRGR